MRKLKKQKLHAIYLVILTVVICGSMWTSFGFDKILALGLVIFITVAGLFDSRYKTFFE